MTIRLPDSRFVNAGPGQRLDPVTDSGLKIDKWACIPHNMTVNGASGPMRSTSVTAWVNRCTNSGRKVPVLRVSFRVYALVGPFPVGAEEFIPDEIIDPDKTIEARTQDSKGALSKAYDIASQVGFDPQAIC